MFRRISYILALTISLGLSIDAIGDNSSRVVLEGFIDNAPQKIKAQTLKQDVEKQATVFLELDVAIDALVNGDFIELLLFDKEYLMTIEQTQAGSPGVITYIGSIFNSHYEKLAGNVLITSGNGSVYGLISVTGNTYQLIQNGEEADTYLLQKMKQVAAKGFTDFPEEKFQGKTEGSIAAISPSDNGSFAAMASSGSTVDVLVLFTPTARANNGGTNATVNWANTIFADLNQKLVELGISSYSFSVKAALETIWPTFPVSYLENITNNGPNACVAPGVCDSLVADQHWVSTNPTVSSLRNQYSADLVLLITADSRKHTLDLAHGFAGLKGDTHGGLCGSRYCGEFVSVRDIYALANLTAHHEIAHAVGLQHADGLISFGFYNDNDEQETNENHIKPFTIMGATPPICLWSSNSSSAGCHVRLPFYADSYQFRKMYYYGWPTLRKFGPSSHVEENIKDGMTWLSVKK